ncbi:MAG TPA: amino acid adenylation domain-containing protein [Thermoanaerobaculia bacterium]|nr:amino acid adenylation domain-containing protein [Thermoanaerobaculia bacterium]
MSVLLEERLASLPPEKRRLLELRLRKEGIGAARPAGPPAIPRRDPAESGPFPLTFGQQRLWFIEQLNPGTAVYNIPFAGRLRGELDPGLLERSLREVVRRHEVLRTRFRLRDGQPVQVIDAEPFVRLPVIDLTALPADPREAEAARLIVAEPQASFDLERGPVLRVSLVKVSGAQRDEGALRPHVGTLRSQLPGLMGGDTGEPGGPATEHVLLVTMPHLVTDAWSMGIFFRELPAIYEAFRSSRKPDIPELPIQVADYALWQRGWLRGEVLEAQLRFWREYLDGAPPVLTLPTDRPRPPVQTFHGNRLPMALPPEVSRGLRPFNDRRGVTSFMTLLAILNVLLQRWSGLDDVLIGSPVVTRSQSETHPLIGFFINMAVVRTRMQGDLTFEELLLRVRDSTLASLAHQDLPFERLTDVMEVPRDSPYPPLVQVSYVLQNVHIPQPAFEGIRLVDSWQTDTGMARFDLSVGVFEEEGEETVPQGGFDYNTDLFDETTILRMRGHFLALAAGALAEPERRISELPMHSTAERHQLLVEWNDTAAPSPGRLFHEMVADLARLRPEAPAVVGPDGAIFYAELERRVEVLAARLRRVLRAGKRGSEVGVAVCLERSPERIIAFLAVLTAGGFYLPLDPDWPAERLRYQLRDAGAAVVVTTRELAERLGLGEVELVLLDEDEEGVSGTEDGSEGSPGAGEDSLAYVFYTSGSTGRPKGVMIPHRGLVNLAVAVRRAFGEAPGERVLQVTAPGFDASVLEMAMALPAGRALHVASPGTLLAGPELAGFAAERAATLGALTPTVLASVPEESFASLRGVVMGGEACPPELASRWAARVQLFNNYGPPETTVCCTADRVEPGLGGLPRPSIGRTLANLRIDVLDACFQPVPLGAHGEICVGGPSLARGYLGRPELTAASFVPDPFSGEPGSRLYRTGDRARHLPDGRLDFLGRLDGQVKVRGIRIEPGEIEAILQEHPAVREAAVVLREGEGRLMACVALYEEVSQVELRSWLRERLPEPMMPAAFVLLEALPLTSNHKLDRRALSRLQPEAPDTGKPPNPQDTADLPATDKERLLVAIWASALKRDRVGLHDDFFALGGDSILAIQVVSRAAEAGLFVEPRQLFAHPTVAGLAAVAAGAPRTDAEQGPVTGPVPLTPVQRWILEDVGLPVPWHWNLSLLLEADGAAIHPAALARAVARLVEHHDQLRARFVRTGAGWRQEVAPLPETPEAGAAPFTLFDLSALPAGVREAAFAAAVGAVQASFDLQRGPLLRAALFTRGADPVRLLLVVHHLVVDGVSWPVLLADLRAAAAGLPLPPKTTSFRRWAERLREYARTAELRQELDVWREAGDRAAPLPADLPAGRSVGPPLEGAAGRVEVRLDAADTWRLVSEVPEAWPVRTEEVLLTAVAEALAEWRGERTAVLAIEGHGRERLFDDVDLSRTVGWLTSTWPLRLELPDGGGPGASLKEVKERVRRVPGRGIGYGLLRHLADDEAAAALRRQPRPDVSFNYLGRTDDPVASSGPFRLAPEPGGGASDPRNPRPHPLAIDAVVLGGELRLVWIYDRGRWLPETIERVAAAALDHLRGLIAHCLGGEASGHTPVDFPHAGLGAEQLDRLMGKIGRQRR